MDEPALRKGAGAHQSHWLGQRLGLLLFVCMPPALPSALTAQPVSNVEPWRREVAQVPSIDALVAQLASADFSVRQQAVRVLSGVGRPAIGPVVRAAAGGDLEVGVRVLKVLLAIGRAGDDETAAETIAALETLAASDNHPVAGRAAQALRRYRRFLGAALTRRVIAAGGSVVVRPENGPPFAVRTASDVPMAGFVVTTIDLRGAGDVTAARIADLGTPAHVDQLLADGTALDDACVEVIGRWPALEHLYLERTKISPAALEHVGSVKNLRTLWLSGTAISNDALRRLAGLSSLRSLDLEATSIGDDGLAHLAGLEELAELNLRGTGVSDSGMASLAKLPRLQSLALGDTHVSDTGLESLAACRTLQFIDVRGTSVTSAAAGRIKAQLPDLVVRIAPRQ